jgi:hypothetical protein
MISEGSKRLHLLDDAAGFHAASCVCVRRDGGGGEADTCSRSSDRRALHVRLCWGREAGR